MGKRGRPRLYTDTHYQAVADFYRAALATSNTPTRDVAQHFQVPRSKANKWVATCRKRGFLGSTTKGKAGEHSGPQIKPKTQISDERLSAPFTCMQDHLQITLIPGYIEEEQRYRAIGWEIMRVDGKRLTAVDLHSVRIEDVYKQRAEWLRGSATAAKEKP